MTDTSACGRKEIHILWCRDCVSLIRSRFRDQVFDQVSTFGFGLQRSYGKKRSHKSLSMRPTRKVKLTRLVLRRAICSRTNRLASTSLGAVKVRAAAISIPGFADQEQENKTRGLQEPELLFEYD